MRILLRCLLRSEEPASPSCAASRRKRVRVLARGGGGFGGVCRAGLSTEHWRMLQEPTNPSGFETRDAECDAMAAGLEARCGVPPSCDTARGMRRRATKSQNARPWKQQCGPLKTFQSEDTLGSTCSSVFRTLQRPLR
eukprot:2713312-Rhodomonas_salina.1